MPIKINYLKKIYSWLLPFTCVLCGKISFRHQDLCEDCYNELPILTQACPRCATPLLKTQLCGQCLIQPPTFDVTHALFLYQPPITSLILKLKFNHALIHARIFGELLAKKIRDDWYLHKPLPDIIIPIPLHVKRLQERGFNQALEIAKPIAKELKLPINNTASQRIKHTAAQATLSARERRQNIKNAFVINYDMANQHVAVIDDVITTGHTVMEFCNALKHKGARAIDVWCCARPCILK